MFFLYITLISSNVECDLSTMRNATIVTIIDQNEHTFNAAYLVDGCSFTSTGETFEATETDQVVFLVVNGGQLTLTDSQILKSGDANTSSSSGDNIPPLKLLSKNHLKGPKNDPPPAPPGGGDDDYNFYGLNSAVVTVGSTSKTVLNNYSIVTNSTGSNAVFATDSGTFEITNIRIKTYKDSSRGLDSTYSGNITAYGININTEGEHCAPLATDRGEGWVTVFGNSNNQMNLLKSSGEGSPCVYSTGNITVVDVIGEATGSEAAVVKGKNSINLTNCELVGYVKHGIMLYQSMSMDADIGTALFYSYHSSITTKSEGPMIYITNTHAKAYFYNSSFTFTSNILLKAAADQWGDEGSNGGSCEMLIENMSTTGDVIAAADDSNLTLTVVASNWSGNVEGNVLVIKKDSEDDDGEDIVPTDKSQTLSRNAIIGIGVAAGVAVIALIAIIVYFVIKKKRNQSPGFNKI